MNSQTVSALAEINRRFYRRFAAEFSASRQRPWPGWDRLLARLKRPLESRGGDTPHHGPPGRAGEPLTVLDVGCGNGRFATFLSERWPQEVRYLGIDSCGPLLDLAAERLQNCGLDLRLLQVDLLGGGLGRTLESERFDLIVVFGVLHHLPGFATRRSLWRRLARRLRPQGILAASVWQLHRRRDFPRRALPWSRHLEGPGAPSIDLDQLEEGDTLLTWSGDETTPRYCHFPGAPEIAAWTSDLALILADRYQADGPGGGENLYLVFETATSGKATCPTSA